MPIIPKYPLGERDLGGAPRLPVVDEGASLWGALAETAQKVGEGYVGYLDRRAKLEDATKMAKAMMNAELDIDDIVVE